jgi:hypothetical protein
VAVVNDQQFIASSTSFTDGTSMSNCGSRSHPWRLEAPVGQRINISLLDFSGSSAVNTPRDRDVTCRQYGFVTEKLNRKNVSICAVSRDGEVRLQREKTVFTSESNRVDVILTTGTSSENNFLVKINGKCVKFLCSFIHNTAPCTRDTTVYWQLIDYCIDYKLCKVLRSSQVIMLINDIFCICSSRENQILKTTFVRFLFQISILLFRLGYIANVTHLNNLN